MQELRELVAGIILSDPDKFSTVMLGRTNEEYAEWIMKGESWGGTSYAHMSIIVLCMCRAQYNGHLSQVIFWPILVYDRPNPVW